MNILLFCICFIASIAGGICGIGGGVLIKPLLDTLGILSVTFVSFLSSLSVWSMAAINVFKGRKNNMLDYTISVPLGIGSIIGGILGKQLFEAIKQAYNNDLVVGIAQAILLALMMLATLLFVLNKHRITMLKLRHPLASAFIGFSLGIVSSFLGIGGGPMNIAALFFFFSMDTKQAVENSLLIILLSQTANLLLGLVLGRLPQVAPLLISSVVGASLLGGLLSQKLKTKISAKRIDLLLYILLVIIILLSVYNFFQFSAKL